MMTKSLDSSGVTSLHRNQWFKNIWKMDFYSLRLFRSKSLVTICCHLSWRNFMIKHQRNQIYHQYKPITEPTCFSSHLWSNCIWKWVWKSPTSPKWYNISLENVFCLSPTVWFNWDPKPHVMVMMPNNSLPSCLVIQVIFLNVTICTIVPYYIFSIEFIIVTLSQWDIILCTKFYFRVWKAGWECSETYQYKNCHRRKKTRQTLPQSFLSHW